MPGRPNTWHNGEPPTTDRYLGSRVESGTAGAVVVCSVTHGTAAFFINAQVSQADRNFAIAGSVSASTTIPGAFEGTGIVQFSDVQTGLMETITGRTCTITVDATQDIAARRVWGNSQCAAVGDPNRPAQTCSAAGHFVFENCTQ